MIKIIKENSSIAMSHLEETVLCHGCVILSWLSCVIMVVIEDASDISFIEDLLLQTASLLFGKEMGRGGGEEEGDACNSLQSLVT